jgi:hypothetical protein
MAGSTFEGLPLLSWAIDDWEQFNAALKEKHPNFDWAKYLNDYKQSSYDDGIRLLFESAALPLNLGGETEKSRLITTDKPMGVFDFSLASRGMYRVPEYYSEKLAKDFPDKFIESELPSGVVPPIFIKEKTENNKKIFYYEDSDGFFECVIRQKGKTAIDNGDKNAKLKFATRNKKVYLTFKRNRGKVKYVEIYSLFYYTSLDGDVQFAIRHIPALMVSDYLESIGIKVRFYMTRFVQLYQDMLELKEKDSNGNELPLYKESPQKKNNYNMFVQPIIAKDFGEEFDKPMALMTSSRNYDAVYEAMAHYALDKEVKSHSTVYGSPDEDRRTGKVFEAADYMEGVERYRNKYQDYVKKGLFKSKEVLPEAMLFFHDTVIRDYFSAFVSKCKSITRESEDAKLLINLNINPFFNWWMRLSAAGLRNKIELINSNEFKKDFANIEKNLQKLIDELPIIIKNVNPTIKGPNGDILYVYLQELGNKILDNTKYDPGYGIASNGVLTLNRYIKAITVEISTYADGLVYETSTESKEKRDELVKTILTELKNY